MSKNLEKNKRRLITFRKTKKKNKETTVSDWLELRDKVSKLWDDVSVEEELKYQRER
ncbi:MAG: hypothetical protein R6W90_15080 [Ignavibacteriaceae bacterium]